MLPDRAFAASTEFTILGDLAGVRDDCVLMHGVVETRTGDDSAAGEWRLGAQASLMRRARVHAAT
jgi:hypothetical protein